MTLHLIPLNFLINEKKFIFFFISVLTFSQGCMYVKKLNSIKK
jgi:hypothetical protein